MRLFQWLGAQVTMSRWALAGLIALFVFVDLIGALGSQSSTNKVWKDTLAQCPRPTVQTDQHPTLQLSLRAKGNDPRYPTELVVANNLTNEENVLFTRDSMYVYNATWSRDGTFVVFVDRPRDSTGGNLWRVNSDGSDPKQIMNFTDPELSPDYPIISPDITLVMFTANGWEQLYIARTDGSEVRLLVGPLFTDEYGQQFTFATTFLDGGRISYYTTFRSAPMIHSYVVMSLDGSNRQDITSYCDAAH